MSILCTFPGRYGDILWALPTVRAISEAAGAPVDLAVGGEFRSLVPLLERLTYIRWIRIVDKWALIPPNEWECPVPAVCKVVNSRTVHLGYRGWPDLPLPQYVFSQTQREYPDLPLAPLDLDRPWIMVPPYSHSYYIEGWTEAWFELKVGVSICLWNRFSRSDAEHPAWGSVVHAPFNVSTGQRWQEEARTPGCDWLAAARWITGSPLFVGDCSALHVLAVACGKPVLCLEPMTARHNEIFYPLGKTGRVKLITGNDDLPTHDARHLGDAIEEALRAR